MDFCSSLRSSRDPLLETDSIMTPELVAVCVLIGATVLMVGTVFGLECLLRPPYLKTKIMSTYKFNLYRRRRNYKTGAFMVSSMSIWRRCEDPFVTRIEMAREFPKWGICADFTSDTDEAFEDMFPGSVPDGDR